MNTVFSMPFQKNSDIDDNWLRRVALKGSVTCLVLLTRSTGCTTSSVSVTLARTLVDL